MPDNNVYGYTLRDNSGKVVYIGISDNPRARRIEHRLSGKQFKEIKIETKPMSRHQALKWEKERLKSYRNFVGRNPTYDKTGDGGFGFMKSRPITQRDLDGLRGPRRSRRSGTITQRDLDGLRGPRKSRRSRTITQRDLDGRPR